MKYYRYLCLMPLLLALGACQLLQKPPQQELNWQLDGKLAVRGTENISAQIRWQQHDEHFNIRLSGPLGMGSISLEGNEQHAILRKGNSSISAPLEDLMRDSIGIAIASDQIVSWLFGQPKNATHKQFNDEGRLSQFSAGQLDIKLDKYKSVGEKQLAHRIILIDKAHSGTKLILFIQKWQVIEH